MQINSRQIIKISFLFFILGFFYFYYLEINSNLEVIRIDDIKISNVGEYVKVLGFVKNYYLKNQTLFLEICDNIYTNNSILGVVFNYEEDLIFKNQNYSFIGKISLYKTKPQIIIEKILK